jgi:hypothetical protein
MALYLATERADFMANEKSPPPLRAAGNGALG